MRWFVEISSIGAAAAAPVQICVDAPQWQPALQKARASRGDEGPLSNFSIEVLEEGYRAVDPATRQRYFVRKAPDDAPLTTSAPAATPAPPVSKPEPLLEDTPAPKARAPMVTSPFGSTGDVLVRPPEPDMPAPAPVSKPLPAKRATVQGMPAVSGVTGVAVRKATVAGMAAINIPPLATTQPQITVPAPTPAPATTQPKTSASSAAIVAHKLHSSREENATSKSPLTYREFVYVVAEGTTEDAAKTLLLDRLDNLVKNLGSAQNKLVQLAVFDHAYQGRPQRKPLATLAWKDWRGEPSVVFPGRAGEPAKETPPPAKATVTPLPAKASVTAPAAKASPSVASAASKAPTPAAKVSTAPPAKASVPPPRVKTADEIMAELSGAVTDLHFLRDALEGADFIHALVKEKFPSDVVLVWFHDAAKRELVLVRQTGGTTDQHLSRMSDKAGLAQAALRSQRAVVIPDAARDPRANEARWKAMGVEPKSIVIAPVMHSGKPYGLLEVLNPKAGGRFGTVENNALTYLGQQLAEFIASNGTILESDRIMAGAKRIAS